MFSGIVEEAAPVVKTEREKDNLHITMRCSFTSELKIDQSISHNGVCLTVVKIEDDTYTVTAIRETLDKTNLGLLRPGDKVNLECDMLGKYVVRVAQLAGWTLPSAGAAGPD